MVALAEAMPAEIFDSMTGSEAPLSGATKISGSIRTLLLILFVLPAWRLAAQDRPVTDTTARAEAPYKQGRLALFLDCDGCDDEHIRQEIPFVDHVRDRERADVHVLVTDESTGSGGDKYTLHVIGRGLFEGEEYQVAFSAPPTATEDLVRNGIARTLKVALAPFLMRTAAAARMSLEMESQDVAEFDVEVDPWNGWTFEIYGEGNGDMEASQYHCISNTAFWSSA